MQKITLQKLKQLQALEIQARNKKNRWQRVERQAKRQREEALSC